jgi:hypothetical protein
VVRTGGERQSACVSERHQARGVRRVCREGEGCAHARLFWVCGWVRAGGGGKGEKGEGEGEGGGER